LHTHFNPSGSAISGLFQDVDRDTVFDFFDYWHVGIELCIEFIPIPCRVTHSLSCAKKQL